MLQQQHIYTSPIEVRRRQLRRGHLRRVQLRHDSTPTQFNSDSDQLSRDSTQPRFNSAAGQVRRATLCCLRCIFMRVNIEISVCVFNPYNSTPSGAGSGSYLILMILSHN